MMMRITFLLFLCLSQTLSSQTVIWNGDGDGDNWADSSNWDTNMLPEAGDSVIIANSSGLANFGLRSLGGTFINESSIIINAEDNSRGIVIFNPSTLMHQKAGTIQINLTSANGIDVSSGELKIDPGAAIEVNDPPLDYYLQIDSTAIFDCQGILDLGN